MNDTPHDPTGDPVANRSGDPVGGAARSPFTRRRLFELSGATAGLAALLAACGRSDASGPGRVGRAPAPSELPEPTVDDAVYLRTMQSLEKSILEAYGVLAGLDGVDEATSAAVARYTDDHTATAESLAGLVADEGGEPYDCANRWLMDRAIQPALDNVVGRDRQADDPEIAPSDDPGRDAKALINALETLAQATYQQMVEKLSTPALRAAVIPFGAQAARRAAAIAIMAGGDEDRFVSPELFGEVPTADEAGFLAAYAIPSRFGQLTPIDVVIGAPNELDLRYTATFQTPADNAYVYPELTCDA